MHLEEEEDRVLSFYKGTWWREAADRKTNGEIPSSQLLGGLSKRRYEAGVSMVKEEKGLARCGVEARSR